MKTVLLLVLLAPQRPRVGSVPRIRPHAKVKRDIAEFIRPSMPQQ